MKWRTANVARRLVSRRRLAVGMMLALGGPHTFASASLSASEIKSPPARETTVAGGDAVNAARRGEPEARVAWWTGFRDSALNLLEQLAVDRPRRLTIECTARQGSGVRGESTTNAALGTPDEMKSDDTGARLASAYVQARVMRIRLATAQAIMTNARRQTEQSGTGSGPAGAQESTSSPARRASSMAERARNAAHEFEASLELCVSELSEMTGMAPALVRTALEPSLSSLTLPVFGVVVPSRLPALVVRGRADVRALETSLIRGRNRSFGQYHVAEFAAALEGWIVPRGESSDATEPRDVLGRAAGEVSVALYRLVRQQQAAAMNYAVAGLRLAEFNAVQQRQALGEATESEMLDKHLLLLVENDRLAAAVGAVAQAWIALNAATGGQAGAAAGDLSPQNSSFP